MKSPLFPFVVDLDIKISDGIENIIFSTILICRAVLSFNGNM